MSAGLEQRAAGLTDEFKEYLEHLKLRGEFVDVNHAFMAWTIHQLARTQIEQDHCAARLVYLEQRVGK